jgi:hypothetical protein
MKLLSVGARKTLDEGKPLSYSVRVMKNHTTTKTLKVKPSLTSSYILMWDWKEDAPVGKIAALARQYPYQYETTLDSDQTFLFFTNFEITNDSQASALLG